jgi:ribosome biogenesis GTPase
MKGKFRIKGIKSTNPIAVGDVVDYELEESSDTVTGTTIFTRERITSFEISEFIPSDAYYCF